jgi:putative transposase
LTPKTTAAPDGSTKGQASSLPRRRAAPGAKPLTVYGWRGKGHLPALLRRPLEPAQYTSIAFTERLAAAGVSASVGTVGDAYDNALAESVIGLFKTELIKPHGPWCTAEQVQLATLEYVDWFNHRRLYEACGDIPPAELEAAYYRQNVALTEAGQTTT